jgi:hypothetical protein
MKRRSGLIFQQTTRAHHDPGVSKRGSGEKNTINTPHARVADPLTCNCPEYPSRASCNARAAVQLCEQPCYTPVYNDVKI